MVAALGNLSLEFSWKWPGYLSPSAGLKFQDIPNGLAAISKVPAAGWAQILAYGGYCEYSGGFDEYMKGAPGDYGFQVLTSSDPEAKQEEAQCRGCQWSPRNDGYHRDVFSGWADRFCLG